MSRKKSLLFKQALFYVWQLVVLDPLVDLGLSQTLDVLAGEGRGLAAAGINKVQAAFGLEQDLFVAGRIAVGAVGALLDQGSGFGIVFLLADDLLHGMNLLSLQHML